LLGPYFLLAEILGAVMHRLFNINLM